MGDELNKAGEACAARALSNCPISWVKHEAANAGNPYFNQLILVGGMESYGRYWRLVELLSNTTTHAIPREGEQGYRGFQLGLHFNCPEEYEAFIATLIDLELVTVGSSGRRGMPLVDESALAIGKARLNGSKGGRTAARNRQR